MENWNLPPEHMSPGGGACFVTQPCLQLNIFVCPNCSLHSAISLKLQNSEVDSHWENFKNRFKRVVLDVVKFAKKIQGFTSLELKDQAILIKEGCLEVRNKTSKGCKGKAVWAQDRSCMTRPKCFHEVKGDVGNVKASLFLV